MMPAPEMTAMGKKRKRVLITTPHPTVEEVAKVMGVSKKRLKQLKEMADKIISRRYFVVLQFANKEAFGNFCVALWQDRVSFTLGGSLAIAFPDERMPVELPAKSKKLFRKLKKQGLVNVVQIERKGRRRVLPSRAETLRRIRRLNK